MRTQGPSIGLCEVESGHGWLPGVTCSGIDTVGCWCSASSTSNLEDTFLNLYKFTPGPVGLRLVDLRTCGALDSGPLDFWTLEPLDS